MKRGGYLWHLALSLGTRLAMIGLRLLRNVLLARCWGRRTAACSPCSAPCRT